MKKEIAITIKNPRLRMFRNNLRIILWLYKSKEWNRLFKEKEKILWNSDGSKHCLLNSEKLVVKEIQLEMNRLVHVLNHSICKCRSCSKFQSDMVYNVKWDYWFCVDCYHELQEYYCKSGESHVFP